MLEIRTKALIAATLLGLMAPAHPADKKYGPGVTDTEIKIGQTTAYSGPASALSTVAVAQAAYVKMLNDNGGVNGRKINLISLDDAYSPAKTVEQIRKLVESDEVLLIFAALGTAPNAAVQKYLNQKKVPQLFVSSGASRFNDPEHFPYTTGWSPNYSSEARVYARYVLDNMPKARIGILWQNDDLGRDYVNGMKEGLGEKADQLIVKEVSFSIGDPTIDSQLVALKEAGADVFFNVASPKAAAQAIRKAYELNWHPLQFLINGSSSIASVLKPAGLDASRGIISAAYQKDPSDPQWKDDPAVKNWTAWMDRYRPDADKRDFMNVYGYNSVQTLVEVLKLCGDDLTQENVMRQAKRLNASLPMLLPGVRLEMSATDLRPIKQLWLQKFDGERWALFGDVIDAAK